MKNWKGLISQRSRFSQLSTAVPEEVHVNLSTDYRCPSWESNRAPPCRNLRHSYVIPLCKSFWELSPRARRATELEPWFQRMEQWRRRGIGAWITAGKTCAETLMLLTPVPGIVTLTVICMLVRRKDLPKVCRATFAHAEPVVSSAVTMTNAVFWAKKPSTYLTGDTLHLRYRVQPVNAIYDLRFPRRWLWRMPSSGLKKPSPYLKGDTLSLRNRAQPVNAI
jgi:hypothetical protein